MNNKEIYSCDKCETYSGCDSYEGIKTLGWYVSCHDKRAKDVICKECLGNEFQKYNVATKFIKY